MGIEKMGLTIERWDVLEIRRRGTKEGNPFAERTIYGFFHSEKEEKKVKGFYDGNGEYVIRFMPSFEGIYQFEITGNYRDDCEETYLETLDQSQNGSIEVTSPGKGNHGPVHVAEKYHFAYEDKTPYLELGTTCYAWLHQPEEMRKQTLETLKQSPFNKIRFCVFPKHYDYNLYEPVSYPYEGTPCSIEGINRENFKDFLPSNPENKWDYTRFNPVHFQILEQGIRELQKLGIEADIILFHPYDRWGFSEMGREADHFYLQYVIARFAAFRNVWWSLANEYDLFLKKDVEDWEDIASVICEEDPYSRLSSIHNCKKVYDHSKKWITHCSIQRTEIYESAVRTKRLREEYGKPVVLDEVGYEGNINYFWGNLTAEEMVRLFWAAAVRGGYCGHGETYVMPDSKLWWSHGGVLHGQSAPRLEFMKHILEEVPGGYLKPAEWKRWDDNCAMPELQEEEGNYFLCYTDRYRPAFREFHMEKNSSYQVDIIDTWNMTITDAGVHGGDFYIDLPGIPYIAIRLIKVQ